MQEKKWGVAPRAVAGGHYNDLHSYDISTQVWTDLNEIATGTIPLARDRHGFAAAGAMLYAHGGQGFFGLSNNLYGSCLELAMDPSVFLFQLEQKSLYPILKPKHL